MDSNLRMTLPEVTDYLPCYEQFQQPLVCWAIVACSEVGLYLTYATRRLRRGSQNYNY
jgi:hypothetical protein